MPSSRIERKLAAIMFTDIAGYTEQMSKDQDVAFSLLETKQKALRPLIKKHNGTLIKQMGDGTLSHFPSAVDASNCSIELQKAIKDHENLNVRIGVHLGDTMFKDDDVFGDGVNIASRLERMSPPGGVLVSKNVYDELVSRKGYDGVSLGLQALKGIGRLVEVFALKDDHLTVPKPADYKDTEVHVHSGDEVPSIAIIPFDNKGSNEDVFYAYGISADLISDCSSAGLIRVSGLKEIEELGDIPFKEKAKKLFVRYVAMGTLWKKDDIFQLSIELYDTKTTKVIWSDRWQENWDNLPMIKEKLSEGLLKALNSNPKVETRAETISTEAYEYYLRAKYKFEKRKDKEDMEIIRGLLQKAIKLDAGLSIAKNLYGNTYLYMGNYIEAMDIYKKNLMDAEIISDELSMGSALNNIGFIYRNQGNYKKALDFFKRSLKIKEKVQDKHGIGNTFNNLGIIYSKLDDFVQALHFQERSLKIRQILGDKSGMGTTLTSLGVLYRLKRDDNKALNFHRQALSVREEIGDYIGVGNSKNNIGHIYLIRGDYNNAFEYLTKSLEIRESLGDKRGIGNSLNNIAVFYLNNGDYKKSFTYFSRSLSIKRELGDKRGIGITTCYIGIVNYYEGCYNKAKQYFLKSL